ncbi:MAG: toprim domain-containing protein [Hallerella porci]|uniref:CHC2-type zinc finger protein n=1 Tax=Hallerella porci TaxID=1945871 RepID=A0ABX5LNN0_9BACT|nr:MULTISPECIES: toprim domain-containing protein [Hallerella]MCI5601598.1 toprim domain-containing protein [Hallerella sp.]MDY3920985.1 toprim domain-containing protein [Hallerella porci]PWL03736.1 CHC2-type zinc finger protein [Hallerella porci]
MNYSRDDIEALKASLSITQVAERLGHHVVRGKFRCPYAMRHAHGDRTPSVSLSESKGLFNCWVCQDVRGDAIRLVEISRNLDFRGAVDWLQAEFFPETIPAPGTSETHLVPNFAAAAPPIKVVKVEPKPEIDPILRAKIILNFFEKLSPIEGSPAASWLVKRRIFKKTWESMRLRYITDYDKVNRELLQNFGIEALQKAGLFNENGNLRYYKHRLLFPYLDKKIIPLYFQARAIDNETQPKELNLRGTIPFPFNLKILDGNIGWVYLCEGCVDTLTMIDRGFPAVGIPGVKSFKTEWANLFKNKRVILCLDQDDAGRAGTESLLEVFKNAGIDAAPLGAGISVERFQLSEGQDMNSWFGGKR